MTPTEKAELYECARMWYDNGLTLDEALDGLDEIEAVYVSSWYALWGAGE